MLKTIEGTYSNGQIQLTETPTDVKTAKVIVTFIEVTEETETEANQSVYDLASDLFGKHDSGLDDLATNKKYLEGLGRD